MVKKEIFESEDFHFKFVCGNDPTTGKGWEKEFWKSDFLNLDEHVPNILGHNSSSFRIEKLAAKQ